MSATPPAPTLADLARCFEGVVPAVIATRSGDGVPNVTYLSRVRAVDGERIAISNQFFSKTSRNLVECPRASLLLVDPTSYDQYRLTVVYDHTAHRGPVFDRLRDDVDEVAALSGMEDVFRLRAADVFRVEAIERTPARPLAGPVPGTAGPRAATRAPAAAVAALCERLARSADLDALVGNLVEGLAELFGWQHSALFLLDEAGGRLYTIASHGYPVEGVGSEVPVGEGTVGRVAVRGHPVRSGSLRQMTKYSRRVRSEFEAGGEVGPGYDIPVPGLPDANSRLAVPAMALGRLVGVLMVESRATVAFDDEDEAMLATVAAVVASGVEAERARARSSGAAAAPAGGPGAPDADGPATHVRFFPVDGSTFLDGDYLIKGVAGRILWSLLGQYEREGRTEFTNREVRLDPALELPEYRDNLESRLILLKRRLEERRAPIRLVKTGRGRFRLDVGVRLRLDAADHDPGSPRRR